jgi:hypothetical protein
MVDIGRLWAGISNLALDIPIEIRDENFVLVRRSTIGSLINHTIGLKSGDYTMTACLPTGHQLVQVIPVDEKHGVDLDAVRQRLVSRTLDALKTDLVSSVSMSATNTVRGAAPISFVLPAIKRGLAAIQADPPTLGKDLIAALGLEGMGASTPTRQGQASEETKVQLNFRLFTSSFPSRLIEARAQERFEVQVQSGTATMKNELPYAVTVQLLQVGEPALNIVMPSEAKMLVKIPRFATTPSLTMLLDEDFIDELIDLRTAGYLSEAVAVAQSIDSAQIVDLAKTRPAAAIAAAYIVLRTGNFDVASIAIDELGLQLPLGTDLTVLAAEVNARKGRHPLAACGFRRATELGLPVASAGLGYLIDRLRFYCTSESVFLEPPPMQPSADISGQSASMSLKECLDKVQPFAFRCDFTLPFTNYTGVSPDRPDDKELDGAAVDRIDAVALQLAPS